MALPIAIGKVSLAKWYNPFTWGEFKTKWVEPIAIKIELNGECRFIPLYVYDKENLCRK